MQQVFKSIGHLAAADVDRCSFTGESGTGKELVARAIYHHSQPCGKTLPGRQLRRYPRAASRKRVVRTRKWGIHRRHHAAASESSSSAPEARSFSMKSETCLRPVQSKMSARCSSRATFRARWGGETIQTDVRIIAATNQRSEAAVRRRRFPRGSVLPAARIRHQTSAAARAR